MRRERFGPTETRLPVMGLGTWNMEQDDHEQAVTAMRRALDLGLNHLDTAELYGMGEVETLVGRAIAGRRHEAFLVSKVMPRNATRRGTVRACEASLERLGTDYLDVYLLHWPGPHPLEETLAGFEDLVAAGKIRAYGVSNFDVHEMEAVERIVGPGKLACNQVIYHLKERAIEHAVIPWCEAHEVAVVAYSPYGSGDFPSPTSAGGQILAQVASETSATPHQVALAFLTRRSSVFAIPKTSRPERVREIWDAGALCLTEAQLGALDAAFPLGPRPTELPTI